MKGYIHAALLLACALLATPALAAPAASASSTRVTLKLNPSGEQRSFDSLATAFHDLYEQYGSIGFYDTQVLDYSTFGKQEKLIDADRAYFLVDADRASGAAGEYKVVAFADRKAASAAQKKLGGELRDFEDAWSAVADHFGVDLNPQPAARPAQVAAERPVARPARQEEAHCST